MAQTNINIRMDENLKRDFGSLCSEMGMTMTTAFTVFAKAVTAKRTIPVEILAEGVDTHKTAATDTVENMAGILHKYADASLIPHENEAWAAAVKEKYAAD